MERKSKHDKATATATGSEEENREKKVKECGQVSLGTCNLCT